MTRELIPLALVVIGVLLWTPGVHGQIRGTVVDEAGAPLLGVAVSASPVQARAPGDSEASVEQLASDAHEVSTDERGRYSFSRLSPGTYSMTFMYAGFATCVIDDIELRARAEMVTTIVMPIGGPDDTINLTPVVVTLSRTPLVVLVPYVLLMFMFLHLLRFRIAAVCSYLVDQWRVRSSREGGGWT